MTNSPSALHFSPFRLDLHHQQLWRGSKEITLRRQTFAVLRYLLEHAGEVVSKDALLEALWSGVYVTDVAPMLCIRELRTALGDDAQHPRFIQTIHRRGYRWVAPLTTAPPVQSPKSKAQGRQAKRPKSARLNVTPSPSHPFTSSSPLVGREAELAQLHQWFEKARNGERQMVFITGEPGIGKTALIDAFVAQVTSPQSTVQGPKSKTNTPQSAIALVAHGQCIEQYGAGEPYLPVLEALGWVGQGAYGKQLKAVLQQHAPTWLAQLPGLVSSKELKALQLRMLGATRECMLRELAEALEMFTGVGAIHELPLLVLVLEDLHWSDASTIELLATLARRHESARLMVIGTYRPSEVAGQGHPLGSLVPELRAHERCVELALPVLTEASVAAYLDARLPVSVLPTRLAQVLHQRTGGNPLFLTSLVHDWVHRGVLLQTAGSWVLHGDLDTIAMEVPDGIRQLMIRQQHRLPSSAQRVLEAASVAGLEFSAASVAAALAKDIEAVEERCVRVAAQQQFLRPAGIVEWPDGTVAQRFRFAHALYQQLWHEQVSLTRQQQWHRRIGTRKEAAYGTRAGEIAAELAVHFEQGREYPRAIRYLQQAGEYALQRNAHTEAITHLTTGLALLKTLPDTSERTQHELRLQTTLGPALMATKGYAAPEVEQTYARAHALCRQVGETPQLLPVLRGLSRFYIVRAQYHTACELGRQLLSLAHSTQGQDLFLEGHLALGMASLQMGELVPAQTHLAQGVAFYDPQQHRAHAFQYGQDPGITCLSAESHTLWLLGYPAQAVQRSQEALARGRELAHSHSLAFALSFATWSHHCCGDWPAVHALSQELMALATEHQLALWAAQINLWQGLLLSEQGQPQEGLARIQHTVSAWQATGAALGLPFYLSVLAKAYGKAGRAREGAKILAQALAQANNTGECYWEAELYRLKGQLTLQRGEDGGWGLETSLSSSQASNPKPQVSSGAEQEAEECFHKAIAIARQQEAKSLELRAVISLSRLWQRQGKQKLAYQTLAPMYGWFTEGFDTADLQEAKALLKAWSRGGGDRSAGRAAPSR